MITEQKRILRKSQGYDLGFEYNGKIYWLNTDTWDEDKEAMLFKKIGLRSFREGTGNKNLVIYDPEYFEATEDYLYYKNNQQDSIPQPINISSAYKMFHTCTNLTSLDLSNWDVSNVRDMNYMFYNCKNLYQKYNIEDAEKLLHKIIEDSNNTLTTMNLF